MSSQTTGSAPSPAPDGGAGAPTGVLPLAPVATGSPGSAPVAGQGRRTRGLLVGAGVLVAAAAVGAAVVLTQTGHHRSPTPLAGPGSPSMTAPARPVAALPVAAVLGVGPDGTLPWQGPLAVTLTGGQIESVKGTDPNGVAVTGAVGPDGTWTAATGLVPAATYDLVATTRDVAGVVRTVPVRVTTAPPLKTLGVTLAPGDGAVVGVGQAISLRLATPVTDRTARAEIEKRLTVTAVPPVAGAWRWMSSSELRYRGPDLWAAGTKITVSAPLDHVQAAPGVWGNGTRTSSFTVGDALTSVVDVNTHTMTVSLNGQVVRTMKASMGKPGFDTRNGTFVVLEKFADRVMDSATVNLPPGTPAYKTAVKDAVRITNSGTFTHGAPWSVSSQGRANVSHGCVNLSPADAHWYFLQAKRGDVVTVVGSPTGPVLSDAGSQDWNMSFDQWKSGSALA